MKLLNVKLYNDSFRFENTHVYIENGVFVENAEGESVDCNGLIMLPGLVDIHTHGAVGLESCDASFDALDGLSCFYAQHGTTAFLPTLPTLDKEKLVCCARNIADAIDKVSGARIGGIHMEGPYFSLKYRGAQAPEVIRTASVDEFYEINSAAKGAVKLISLAPETDGAEEFIRSVKDVTRVAAGHTDADYETMSKAIGWGVSHLTHTFNAMRGLHHRAPGALGAAIDGEVTCECICDGMHVHPAMVRLLYKAVGAERLVLVSDSLRSAYLPDGEYESCGQKIYVKDGKATLADGTIAGSSSTLLDCLRCAVEFGIPVEDAVRAATYNPAKAVGIEKEYGQISIGRSADFILVNEKLELQAVYVKGKKIK